MHSFLIISQNDKTGEEKAKQLLLQHHIHPLDQTELIPEKTLGIEDIRNIQKNLSLFPIKGEKKAIIIYRAELLTITAQHALLKTLEEPPLHTIIILIANSKEHFLSTVLSRCNLIVEKLQKKEITQKERVFLEEFFHVLPTLSIGHALVYAQQLGKNKETALGYLAAGLSIGREYLLTKQNREWVDTLRAVQKTHSLLAYTNTNPRFALEHMIVTLQQRRSKHTI